MITSMTPSSDTPGPKRGRKKAPGPQKTKPLLAYTAHDGDEGWCVVFARSGAAARRRAANEMETEWEGIDHCRRARSLDQYAPGPVPPKALIDIGWWFGCHHCETRVDSDTPNPVFDTKGNVFCSPWCRHDHVAERAVTGREEALVRERLANHVLTTWPGTELVSGSEPVGGISAHHAYVRVSRYGVINVIDAHVAFTFPGGQFRAMWRETEKPRHGLPDGRGLSICHGDAAAWNAFMASLGRDEPVIDLERGQWRTETAQKNPAHAPAP